MTRRFTALLLSCAMMLSLCQLSLATEKADDNAPVEEKALAEEVIPEEAAAPTDETTTALSETAGLAASQQPTMAGETTDTIYTGTLGDNVTWSLDIATGTLTVTGAGDMAKYLQGGSPIWNYRSYIKSVTIDDAITSVGNCAFYQLENLTSVNLGAGITKIGFWAFYSCSALTKVTIPNSVTTIGDHAFYYCRALTEVTIPDSVTTIGEDAFSCCSALTSAEFLGNAPATFDSSVFVNSASFFTIFYHSGTTGWSSPTWRGYPTVCIGAEITDFSTLDGSNRNTQSILFRLNDTAMTATVGANTTDKNNAGYDGSNDGRIVIPDTVTKGEKVYKVIGVSQYAFASYPWVNTVSIGRNVSAIEPSAFRGCKNLVAITVDEGNLQFADQDGVLFDKEGLYLYAYPAGRGADTYEIPETCTTVGTRAFYGASNLVSLTVPTSVNDIGEGAFADCDGLQSIELPFVGGNAQSTAFTVGYIFSTDNWKENACPASLKRITVHGTNLSGYDFSDCSGLKEVYLPDCGALTEIPNGCFYDCSSLQTLVFGTASPEDGMVMIPNTVTAIGKSAFSGCSSLRGVTLGRGVSSLGEDAFVDCIGIEKFAVASGNTSFMADQWGVLYSADQATLHYYPSARAWPYYNVSDKTTTICSRAFFSCEKLVNLFIPKTTTVLGRHQNCIIACPSMTICCYTGSAAARYAISSGITSWYMDNYVMQGLGILSLPERLVFDTHNALVSTPYLTATYGDKTLQLDDYQVVFEKPYGAQIVTFTSGGCSVSAETTVVRQGDINGDSTTAASVVDVQDMQCLYEYLSTDEITGNLKDDAEYFSVVADVNGDSSIDILDYQALYDATRS